MLNMNAKNCLINRLIGLLLTQRLTLRSVKIDLCSDTPLYLSPGQ